MINFTRKLIQQTTCVKSGEKSEDYKLPIHTYFELTSVTFFSTVCWLVTLMQLANQLQLPAFKYLISTHISSLFNDFPAPIQINLGTPNRNQTFSLQVFPRTEIEPQSSGMRSNRLINYTTGASFLWDKSGRKVVGMFGNKFLLAIAVKHLYR